MSPWIHLAAGLFIWGATLRLCGFWRWADLASWRLEFDWHIQPALDSLAADMASHSNQSPEEAHEALRSGL